MIRLTALAALVLAGCGEVPGGDGYVFGQCQSDHVSARVDLVLYPDAAALNRAAREAGLSLTAEHGHERAYFDFGTVDLQARTCRLHLVRPDAGDQRAAWGHAMTHCFCGQWHE